MFRRAWTPFGTTDGKISRERLHAPFDFFFHVWSVYIWLYIIYIIIYGMEHTRVSPASKLRFFSPLIWKLKTNFILFSNVLFMFIVRKKYTKKYYSERPSAFKLPQFPGVNYVYKRVMCSGQIYLGCFQTSFKFVKIITKFYVFAIFISFAHTYSSYIHIFSYSYDYICYIW